MGQITFSRLRDSEDWGLRGSKDSPDEQPPQEGSSVTVTKKSGEQQEVVMGRVIAQGDDWWLAASGATNHTKASGACSCGMTDELLAKLKRLVAGMDDEVTEPAVDQVEQPDAVVTEVNPWG